MDFPSHKKDWKMFELNSKSIAPNVLYVPYNTEKITHAYKSKYNKQRENQVTALMITDDEKWLYLAVKNCLHYCRGVILKHDGDFYCLNCFYSHSTKDKLKKHYCVCKNHEYCYVDLPKEDNKILKYNHGKKSMKFHFIIFADLEPLLEKMSTCYNNPEKLSTIKLNEHTPSSYSVFTHCSFDLTKNKLDCYRGGDCMERFPKNLKEHKPK